jgi:hypothetical protein
MFVKEEENTQRILFLYTKKPNQIDWVFFI